jgi:hypothetical protein
MKKILAVSIIWLYGGVAFAQDKRNVEVPQSVAEAFSCLYPNIKLVNWEFDDVNYTASFKLDGKVIALLFDERGSVVETKNEIKLFELPPDVNDLISKEYSGWTIGKATHIDSNGTAYYETVVEKNEQTMVLVFNNHGGLLMKVLL